MRTFLLFAIVLVAALSSINAAAPAGMNYHGLLADSGGNPVADGSYSVQFSIFNAAVNGNSLWSETQDITTVDGLFGALLGSINPITDSVFVGSTRYLSIKVGTDSEILPRTMLLTVPWAFRVNTVDGAMGGQINGDIGISGKATIGSDHTNAGEHAFVAGVSNTTGGSFSSVSGGGNNTAGDTAATVSGGYNNTASGWGATIGGGYGDTANAYFSTIGGGRNNVATDSCATVGGGRYCFARGGYSVVSGGGGPVPADSNSASGDFSAISGGRLNIASGAYASVGGGLENTANGYGASVLCGDSNTASGTFATVGGGFDNTASGTNSAIPGGELNVAGGMLSFAVGNRAKANHDGSIVIAANSSVAYSDSIRSGGAEQMVLRADGGIYLTNAGGLAPYDDANIITTRGGAYLSGSGTDWTNGSDRNKKENFTPVNGADLLDKISELAISEWNYKEDDESIKHIGPLAQDFYETFGLGNDDKSISTIDPSGIALAGVKELLAKVEQLEARVAELERR